MPKGSTNCLEALEDEFCFVFKGRVKAERHALMKGVTYKFISVLGSTQCHKVCCYRNFSYFLQYSLPRPSNISGSFPKGFLPHALFADIKLMQCFLQRVGTSLCIGGFPGDAVLLFMYLLHLKN